MKIKFNLLNLLIFGSILISSGLQAQEVFGKWKVVNDAGRVNSIVEIYEKVVLLKLNRPDSLNALSKGLIEDLNHALDIIENDPHYSVIVLTGNGKAFAAGADIKEMMSKSFQDVIENDFIKPWEKISSISKPTIAAVNGYALGGGCELAMMCDLLIASEKAKFGQPEINLGTFPGSGGTQRLPKTIGKAKAMDLILTARMIDADEAEKLGLTSRVLIEDNFIEQVLEIAKEISEKSLPVLKMAKAAVNGAFENTLSQGVLYEKKIFQSTFALEDRKEGMQAFIEKRKPKFENK